jgi:hypothetical protein
MSFCSFSRKWGYSSSALDSRSPYLSSETPSSPNLLSDLLPALKGEAFSCNRTKIPVADEVSNIYAVKLDFDRLLKIVPKTLPNLAQKSKDYTQLILIVALIIVATSGAIMFLYTRRRSDLKKSEHRKELHKLWLHQILFLLE